MSVYTKVNIKKEVLEEAKKIALSQYRSVSNLIESLILSFPNLITQQREEAVREFCFELLSHEHLMTCKTEKGNDGELLAVKTKHIKRKLDQLTSTTKE